MIDPELRQLYQEIILDHGKHPRNFGPLDPHSHKAMGNNPLCGDQLAVFAQVDGDGRIEGVNFQGRGCAISTASASMMTEILEGKTTADAEALFQAFHHLCTVDDDVSVPEHLEEDFERLQVLAGVRDFPMRVKCATLGWHTLDSALKGKDEISTE